MIKDVFLQSLVQINCIPILIIIFLLFFLNVNYRFEKELSKKFMPSVVLLVALVVIDNLDYYAYDTASTSSSFDTFHRAAAMLGYDIRILLMASLIAIAAERNIKKQHISLLVYLPALLNFIVLMPCLITDVFFYYNPDGSIGRGPLAYEPHILSAIYMLFLFFLSFISRNRGKSSETGILFLCGLLTIAGFLSEFLFALRGILIGVVALDITFYYLYLHIEHFRFDPLTGIYNRESFNADIMKFGGRGSISHIVSIDLNDLKVINDTLGHNEGDKALRKVASILERSCLDDCFVYRVGGDEFAAICLGKDDPQIVSMTEKMYAAVSAADYACAIGYSKWSPDKTFTEIYKEADDMMYLKKREMKAGKQ